MVKITKRTKRTKRTKITKITKITKRTKKKNVYYNKIIKSMMSKIDIKSLNKKDTLLLDTLFNNLHDICKIYTVKK